MKLNKRKTGLVAGVLAGVTMLIAPAAFATNTLSVDGATSPAGAVAVTGSNVGTLAFNTTGGVPASCTVSSVSGSVDRGASVTAGSTIGRISNLVFGTAGTPCVATALNVPVIIEKSTKVGAPAAWNIVVTSTPAKGATTVPIVINNVTAKMHSTGSPTWVCDLQAQGNVAGTFNQVTQQITINTPPAFPLDLTTYNGAGTNTPASSTCLGLISTLHNASMTGSFTLSTPGVGGIHW